MRRSGYNHIFILISPQKGDFLPFGFGDGDALG
jgi:hypothetical protein